MNWNIIIPIIFIITNILLARLCYWLGYKSVEPIEDINNKILERRRELQDNVDYLKNEEAELKYRNKCLDEKFEWTTKELIHAEEKRKLLEGENKKTLDFIQQSEQLAKEKADAIYEKKNLELEHEYAILKRDHQAIANRLVEKIEKEKAELKSLQETRAAAIEAAKREKEIQESKDEYCLILPTEYKNDVRILRSVSKQIAKPRSILMAIWQAYYAPLAKKKFPQILGKTDVCGIYKITNQETNECYIGQAVDIRRRWMDHCKAGIGIDTPQGNQLYAAMQTHGLDSFSFELLLECDSSQLNEKEKYFIELYNSNAIGYNQNRGVKSN